MARITEEDARNMLGNVPEENVFYCHGGRVLRNTAELRDCLASMSDETFAYHVNPEKNDFSNWVRDVIGDDKLARDLNRAKNRPAAEKSVAERLVFLQKKVAA